MAGGLAVLIAAGGVVVYSVPGMSKPIKGLLTGGKDLVITTVARKGTLQITVVDKGGPGKLRE